MPIKNIEEKNVSKHKDDIIKIPIPDWAFNTSLQLCLSRQRRYRHQFITKKLKDIAGDDQLLKEDIEGVIGYIGDICACIWLGMDPKEEMRSMILDTDLLTHRDEYNVLYKGWNLDIKTEIYPDEKFEKAIKKELLEKETYGCRFININHFLENSSSVDVYLFATLDNKDPRLAKYWIPIGWIYKNDVSKICPEPKDYSPSGAHLWTKCYIIPNRALKKLEELIMLKNKPGVKFLTRSAVERTVGVDEFKYRELLAKVGLG